MTSRAAVMITVGWRPVDQHGNAASLEQVLQGAGEAMRRYLQEFADVTHVDVTPLVWMDCQACTHVSQR